MNDALLISRPLRIKLRPELKIKRISKVEMGKKLRLSQLVNFLKIFCLSAQKLEY